MKWLDKAKTQIPILDECWFDKQDALFNSRIGRFQTKGITEYEAKCLSLRLHLRDYDKVNECHCFECQNLKGTLPFFECGKGKYLPFSINPEALHKCIGYIPIQYGELS